MESASASGSSKPATPSENVAVQLGVRYVLLVLFLLSTTTFPGLGEQGAVWGSILTVVMRCSSLTISSLLLPVLW